MYDTRLSPLTVVDTGGEAASILSTLATAGNEVSFDVTASSSRTITLGLPALPSGGLVFFAVYGTNWTPTATQSTTSADTGFSSITANIWTDSALMYREQVIEIPATAVPSWVKIQLANGNGSDLEVRHFHVRTKAGLENHGYILAIGDSLTEYGMRYKWFNKYCQVEFGRDPIYINRGVGGANIASVTSGYATHSAQHPNATHCFVHVGTNDVSNYGDYASASAGNISTFTTGLGSLYDSIISDGYTLVPMRISHRNDATPVEGWNTNVVDGLISSKAPNFYDSGNSRGLINLEDFTETYETTIISSDNLHYTSIGEVLVNKYQAYMAGSVIYGYDIGEVTDSVVASSAHNIKINFGQVGDYLLDPEEEGVLWNDVLADYTDTQTTSNLFNIEGERTSVGVDITTSFNNDLSSGYIEDSDVFPKHAQRGSYWTNTSAVLNLTGLDDAKSYTIKCYGNRDGSAASLTKYTIGAVSQELDHNDNKETVVSFTGETSSSGIITITVEPGTGASIGYLNAIIIEEE